MLHIYQICYSCDYMTEKEKLWIELFKPNSLSGKIYFLLLEKPLRITEISKIIYNDKIQLTPINRILPELIKNGIILKSKSEDIDARNKYYLSSMSPIIKYCEQKINDRTKNYISKEELETLNIIFSSKWFRSFFNEKHKEYLFHKDWGNYTGIPYSPFESIGSIIEDIGILSATLSRKIGVNQKINYSDINILKDYDLFVSQNKQKYAPLDKKKVEGIIANAKIQLGNYKDTNYRLDEITANPCFIFMPPDLAFKLAKVGHIPLTLFNAIR